MNPKEDSVIVAGFEDLDKPLTLQKSKMQQIQGVKGEAVVGYREPLTTKEMRYPRLSQRVNKAVILMLSIDVTNGHIL